MENRNWEKERSYRGESALIKRLLNMAEGLRGKFKRGLKTDYRDRDGIS